VTPARRTRREPALAAPALGGTLFSSSTEIAENRNTRAGSLSYKVAGQACREAIEVATPGSPALDLRVLLAIIHRTITYSKAADRTSTRELAAIVYGVRRNDVAGWQRRNVSASLRRLKARRAIEYETGRGHAARCVVAIPVPTQGVSNDAPSTTEGLSAQPGKGSDTALKVIEDAATPRNQPEEFSEARCDVEQKIDDVIARLTTDHRSWVRDRTRNVDRSALARLISTHPDAPLECFAGWLLGEPNNLHLYRSAS
jgi:hypothetical protein